MALTKSSSTRPRVVGRSSSHFTRVVRMFAAECGVAYELQVVPSLFANDVEAYGGNPALRLPNLVTAEGTVFGSLPSCRVLASLASNPVDMVWPEGTPRGLAGNALELTVQAMSTEVSWLMLHTDSGQGVAYASKLWAALDGMLRWLNAHVERAIAELPKRDLSYLELSLFCLLEHLEFRQVLALDEHAELQEFRQRFGDRASARATSFHFDGDAVLDRTSISP